MEAILILGIVVLAWAATRPGGLASLTGIGTTAGTFTSVPTAASSAALAAQLNANQRAINLQLPGVMASPPASTGSQLESGFLNTATVGVNAIPVVGQIASAVLAIGGGFLAAHTARIKGAQSENEGINYAVQAFDADLKQINQAFKTGQVNATMAISYLSQVKDNYWSYMNQFQGKPGVRTKACTSASRIPPNACSGPSTPNCDNSCTAGCCVGCNNIEPSIANCIWALQTGYHSPVTICHVFGSKYGAQDRPAYTLSW